MTAIYDKVFFSSYYICSKTENYSFSDLTALAQEAAKRPMRGRK